MAKEALERIAALYAIEEEIRERPAEERRAVRNERSKPLLESLKKWMEETLGKLSRKSDSTKAIRYALGRWDALMRYCDDGRLEIDNNAAECSPSEAEMQQTAIQPNIIATEKPINCQRAAEFLAVHPRTIKRMAAAGELPGHFRFGRWYFYVSELDSWMRTELNSVSHP